MEIKSFEDYKKIHEKLANKFCVLFCDHTSDNEHDREIILKKIQNLSKKYPKFSKLYLEQAANEFEKFFKEE